MNRVYKSPCGRIELREGRWQDVLSDIDKVDACITDPPYTDRTARGFKNNPDWSIEIGSMPGVKYGSICQDDVLNAVRFWWPRVEKWFVVFADHSATRWWEHDLESAGAYVFAPVPWLKTNGSPRFVGDGPSSQTEWITVGRTKSVAATGSPDRGCRRGYYITKVGDGTIVGAKHVSALRVLVSDYSLRGDLIVDPYAGSGTTLLAAAIEGRRAIGCECDPKTYELAVNRLEEGYTPSLF